MPDARAGDHAAVADQDDIGETKALAEFVDLGRHRFRIGGVAGEYLDGDGATLGVGEQAKDDLWVSGLVVAGMAEFGKRAMTAFEISGGQIVEHQAAVREVTFGEFPLDAGLLGEQPVHSLVEFGLIGGIHMEQLAETAVEGVGVKAASGSEFGCGVDDAGHDHSNDEIAVVAGKGVENGVELEVTEAVEDGHGVTVRKRAGNDKGLGQGRASRSERAGQSGTEGIDLMRAQVRDVGDGTGLDLAVEAEGFTEEDGGWGIAVGYGGDIHAYNKTKHTHKTQ